MLQTPVEISRLLHRAFRQFLGPSPKSSRHFLGEDKRIHLPSATKYIHAVSQFLVLQASGFSCPKLLYPRQECPTHHKACEAPRIRSHQCDRRTRHPCKGAANQTRRRFASSSTSLSAGSCSCS